MVPLETGFFFMELFDASTGAFARGFHYIIENETFECPSRMLAELLYAEYKFRYQAQLRERLETANGNNNEAILTEYDRLENDLYFKEFAMPGETLKGQYDFLREEPDWYLREGLVEDCAARGGCCARDCGCCAKRLPTLPRKSISGHCSLACPCCNKRGGDNPASESVALMDRRFKEALESDIPFYLARLATYYFAPRRPYQSLDDSEPLEDNQVTEELASETSSIGDAPAGDPTDEAVDDPPPPYECHVSANKHSCGTGRVISEGSDYRAQ